MSNSSQFIRRQWAAGLAATFILTFIIAAITWQPPNSPPPEFTVGIATWPGFAPGFVAQNKGYFEDLPVEFKILDDFNARRAAYVSGQTHATVYTIDSFAQEASQSVPGKIVLVLDESAGADAILSQREIRSAKDLIGKKVAFTRGSPSHFLLLHYLTQNEISPDQITPIEVDDPGRAGEALASGTVAAAVTWEPNITQLLESQKASVLLSSKATPGLIVDVLVVHPDVIRTRPNDVRRFITAWLKAVNFISEHRSESYKIMAEALKIPQDEFPAMAAGLKFADSQANRDALLNNQGSAAIDLFDRSTELWVKVGINQTRALGRERITGEFMNDQP